MFHEVVDDGPADDGTAAEASVLLASFKRLLTEAGDEAGVEELAESTALDSNRVAAAGSGEVKSLTVDEGAAILAAARGVDVDVVVGELRDHLLLGMTMAVLDVDTIAGAIDADLTGQEVQQALEGRAEMTIAELAEVMAVIEERKP